MSIKEIGTFMRIDCIPPSEDPRFSLNAREQLRHFEAEIEEDARAITNGEGRALYLGTNRKIIRDIESGIDILERHHFPQSEINKRIARELDQLKPRKEKFKEDMQRNDSDITEQALKLDISHRTVQTQALNSSRFLRSIKYTEPKPVEPSSTRRHSSEEDVVACLKQYFSEIEILKT